MTFAFLVEVLEYSPPDPTRRALENAYYEVYRKLLPREIY
jgi:hypothetical protein